MDAGNGKYNLLVLCWGEGHLRYVGACSCLTLNCILLSSPHSPIHDHANSHCFMKILSGSLKETLFHWPEEGQCGSMTQRGSTTYNTDAVTYINGVCVCTHCPAHCTDSCPPTDSIGLHCIENPSHTDTAVSLHIYCPPITCCKCFDQRTGKAKSCQVCFTTRCDSNTCSP